MKRIISLSFAMLFTYVPDVSFAHHSNLRVCNKTGSKIFMAYAHQAGLNLILRKWKLEGRYILQDGECSENTPVGAGAGWSFIAAWKEGMFYGHSPLNITPKNISSTNVGVEPANWKLCVTLNARFEASGSKVSDFQRCRYPDGEVIDFGVLLDLRENTRARTISIF